MSQVDNIAVASELQEVEQLLKALATLKPDSENYQEELANAFDQMATVTSKCLDAKTLFDSQNNEARNLADQVSSLEKKVDTVRKGAKTVVKDRNKVLYNAYLKQFMEEFSALLADFDGKFANSVDARAQANYEGVGLIYNNFENSMVFNGLHTKEEPKAEATEEKAETAETTEEAKAEVKAEATEENKAQSTQTEEESAPVDKTSAEAKDTKTEEAKAEDAKAENASKEQPSVQPNTQSNAHQTENAQARAQEASPLTKEEAGVKVNTENKESK